ncbi:MAG: UDP-N-acetylglucosamine 2-epimerase, partial [Desulfosudaceae bacterium]
MKLLSVVGARPQFIKSLPVSVALRAAHEEVLVHTGQHYDYNMSAVFFEELDVAKPAYNLGVGSRPPGEQIGEMTRKLEPIVRDETPDVVLVYGDTNSTLAAAVVGAHSDACLAHVEAGLRSHKRAMPEEINRVLTDHAADLLFAPTTGAVENLQAEGLAERT